MPPRTGNSSDTPPDAPDAKIPDAPDTAKAQDEQVDSNEFVVLTGALTLRLDAEGKKVRRYARGARVKLDAKIHDIERLVALKAVGKPNDEGKVRYPTAAGLSVSAAQANQGTPPVPADSGAVQQQEGGNGEAPVANGLDDGGKGSDDASPPSA